MHFFTILLKQKNCTVVYSSKIEIHILIAKKGFLPMLSTIAGAPRKHKQIQIMDTFFALSKKSLVRNFFSWCYVQDSVDVVLLPLLPVVAVDHPRHQPSDPLCGQVFLALFCIFFFNPNFSRPF
jgi:hypothetical protein